MGQDRFLLRFNFASSFFSGIFVTNRCDTQKSQPPKVRPPPEVNEVPPVRKPCQGSSRRFAIDEYMDNVAAQSRLQFEGSVKLLEQEGVGDDALRVHHTAAQVLESLVKQPSFIVKETTVRD